MNYEKSKDPIYGTKNHTPKLLQELKNRVTGNSMEEIPFFLMPVRLETRFMQNVHRDIFEEATAVADTGVFTLTDTATTTVGAYGVYNGFTSETTILAGVQIKEEIAAAKDAVAGGVSGNIADKYVLQKLYNKLSVLFGDTKNYLLSECTDPVLYGQLNTTLTGAQSELQQFGLLIDGMQPVDNWQDKVSTTLLDTSSQLSQIISENANHIGEIFTGTPTINDQAFDQFIQSNEQLNQVFEDYAQLDIDAEGNPIPNVYNKLYLWTFLRQIDQQLAEVFDGLEGNNNGGEPVIINNADEYRLNLYKLASGLENAWRTLAQSGGKSWFHSVSRDSTISEQDIPTLNPLAVNIANDVEQQTIQITDIISELKSNIFSDDKVNQLTNVLTNISNTFNTQEHLDDDSMMYVASKLKNLDNSLTDFVSYIDFGVNAAYDTKLAQVAEVKKQLQIRLERITEPEELTAGELNEITEGRLALGQQMEQDIQNAGNNLLNITNQPPSAWDETLFQNYLESIHAIVATVPPLSADLIDDIYLWFKVSPVVGQLDTLSGYVEGKKLSDSAVLTTKAAIADVATTISYKWDKAAKDTYTLTDWFTSYVIEDELWIRVYPDDIFVQSHEPKLTVQEKQAGINYWNEWYNAKNDPKLQLAAWTALVNLYGVERAAWIIKAMFPTNFSTSSNGGTISSTPNSYVAVKSQLGLLNKYMTKVNTIDWASATVQQAQVHLDFLSPHVTGVYNAVTTIDALPADDKAVLAADAGTFADAFGTFEVTLAATFTGEDTLYIGETTYFVGQLENAVNSIDQVEGWNIIYNAPPTFPNVQLKDASWTETACSYVMPDRFFFSLIDNVADADPKKSDSFVFRHTKVGNRIPNPLYMGITPKDDPANPDPFKNIAATNNLQIGDSKIKWMFDFNEAIAKGMATYIPISRYEYENGFHKLVALGVQIGEGIDLLPVGKTLAEVVRDTAKFRLEELLNGHHYTKGLGLLRLGTATNNTESGNAGYIEADPFNDYSWKVQASSPMFLPTSTKLLRRDGQVLADALGIEYAVLQHIEHADKKQISNAIAMNRALWPATIGSFMGEMLNQLFTGDNINRTKGYFTDYVLGRGTLPSIRVGNQPYGILPATTFGNWTWWQQFSGVNADLSYKSPSEYTFGDYFASNANLGSMGPADAHNFFHDRFQIRLSKVLETLNHTWLKMADTYVKTVDKNKGTASTQKDFMEILGQDALMSEAATRFMLNDMTPYHGRLGAQGFRQSAYNPNPTGIGWEQTKWEHTLGLGVSPLLPNIPMLFTSLFNDFKLQLPSYFNGTEFGIFEHADFPDVKINNVIEPGIQVYVQRLLGAFRLLQYDKSYVLRGPTVDEKILSETSPITAVSGGTNFITWLLSNNPETLWFNNQFGGMQSRSLLFLLMRQAILLTYRNTAWDILTNQNIFSSRGKRIVGTPQGIGSWLESNQSGLILTKWHLLFNSANTLKNHTNYGTPFNYFANLDNPNFPASWPSSGWLHNKLSSYLYNPSKYSGYPSYNAGPINELRDAFNKLANEPTAELDRLLKEHIDLCTYRLDAWNYGMVNKRLWDLRRVNTGSSRTKGIYLGAYGWLVNVKSSAKLKALSNKTLPDFLTDSNATTYFSESNLGFVQAPSIVHALTAALLRSGYESERNNADNRFGINLSSERVKAALSLLEGIRNGQTLGALLGYELERGLHERNPPGANLDVYIYVLRKQFPLVPQPDGLSVNNGRDQVKLSNVVDGIELLNYVKTQAGSKITENPDKTLWEIYSNPGLPGSGQYYPIASITGVPSANTTEADAIMVEIDRLNSYVDALGDLMVAEGVFQAAKGNMARSAAALESLTEGKTPPIPEIIDTPRTGVHLTHRMVSFIEPVLNSGQTSPWTSVPTLTPRAKAEPSLNKWVANMLTLPFSTSTLTVTNLPDKVGCKVSYKDQDDQDVSFDIKLKDLQLQPIDLLYMVQDTDYTQELTKRISYFTRSTAANYYTSATITGIPQEIPLTIHLMDKGTASGVVVSFHQVLSLISNIANLVRTSRWLKAADFINAPNPAIATPAIPLYDRAELAVRLGSYNNGTFDLLTGIFGDFQYLYDYFDNPLSITTDTQLNTLKTKLFAAAGFGIDFGLPLSAIEAFSPVSGGAPIGTVATDLLAAASQVKDEVVRRNKEAGELVVAAQNLSPTADEEAIDKYLKAAAIVFGNEFKVLPLFRFGNYINLQADIAAQLITNPLGSNDILRPRTAAQVDVAMEDWLYALARVNDKADNIESLRLMANDDNAHLVKKIRPVQFPFVTTPVADYWLGTEFDPALYTPSGDKLSVTVINYPQFSASAQNHCGLFIDEWTEHIPFTEEMTGITFHYDQPNAKPPQNVLLAVNPYASGEPASHFWTLEHLVHTMLDTMEMSKIRMVEPDHFKAVDGRPETQHFDIFKWLLPAVVGEVTPHIVSADNTTHVNYLGKNNLNTDDSTQQVSFEYNVNNNGVPNPGGYDPGGGTPASGSSTMIMDTWAEMDTDAVLTDSGLQEFMAAEIDNTEILTLQNELNNNLQNL